MRVIFAALLMGLSMAACGGGPGLPARSDPGLSFSDFSGQVAYVVDAQGTFCSGLILSATVLLTAEHCFDDRQDPVRVRLVDQSSRVLGSIIARGSQYLGAYPPSARDLALVRIVADPAPQDRIHQIPKLTRALRAGEQARVWIPFVDSHGAVRLMHRSCPVLGQADGVVELACHTQPGASGAPVFVLDRQGWALAGVLVARGQQANAGIAVAAHAELLGWLP